MLSRPAILLFCILTLVCCNKNNPVGPPETPPESASTTAVIGASGGSLVTGDFTLTVPQGAFSHQETLKVAADAYDSCFGSQNVSALFRLEGLPSDFTKPLDLKIRCRRTPATGQFIALGNQVADAYTGSQAISYSPLSATVDSGFLRATILPNTTASQGRLAKKNARPLLSVASIRWFLGLDDMVIRWSSEQHFMLFYPRYIESQAVYLGGVLELALSTYKQFGFDTEAENFQQTLPAQVIFGYPPSVGTFRLGSLYVGQNRDWNTYFMPTNDLAFNSTALVTSDDKTLTKAAGELVGLLLCVARDRAFQEAPLASSLHNEAERIWPYFSIISFFGDLLAPPGTGKSCPLDFRMYQVHPLAGISATTGETPREHGLGFSALLSYLFDTNSYTVLPEIFNGVKDVSHGADAIVNAVTEDQREWWPGFLERYIAGKIYQVKSEDLLADLSSPQGARVFTIGGKTDTLKKFSETYTDISTKLFRVNLEYPGIDTSSTLKFSVGPSSLSTQYVGVMLFGLKDNILTYWQYANSVTVSEIRNLTLAGYDIVAAVVNCLSAPSYDGSRPIELTVRVNGATSASTLQASFLAKMGGKLTDTYNNTLHAYVWYSFTDTKHGTVSENTYTASWNGAMSQYPNKIANGNLTLSFDNSSPPHLIGFALRDTVKGDGETYAWHLTSSSNCNIPGVLQTDRYVFEVTGSATRDLVGTLEYFHSRDTGYWEQFVSFEPGVGDLMYIVVEKW
jgi:hypothetical protein